MKRVLAMAAAVGMVLVLAPRALAQTAEEVVEKHLAAVGGRATLAKLTSQVAAGTVAIQAQGADLRGTIEITKKAPNKSRTLMRIDLSSVGGSEMIATSGATARRGSPATACRAIARSRAPSCRTC